eukprot:Platyproteum_vivax@DN6315_c0_g1_i1.p1
MRKIFLIPLLIAICNAQAGFQGQAAVEIDAAGKGRQAPVPRSRPSTPRPTYQPRAPRPTAAPKPTRPTGRPTKGATDEKPTPNTRAAEAAIAKCDKLTNEEAYYRCMMQALGGVDPEMVEAPCEDSD